MRKLLDKHLDENIVVGVGVGISRGAHMRKPYTKQFMTICIGEIKCRLANNACSNNINEKCGQEIYSEYGFWCGCGVIVYGKA